jgi:hypothetical protein
VRSGARRAQRTALIVEDKVIPTIHCIEGIKQVAVLSVPSSMQDDNRLIAMPKFLNKEAVTVTRGEIPFRLTECKLANGRWEEEQRVMAEKAHTGDSGEGER